MKSFRLMASALIVAFAAILTSCAETTAPVQPPQSLEAAAPNEAELLELLSRTTSSLGLMTCRPLPFAQSTATIGPRGGTIYVGPHRLTIPAGALDSNTTITATAPSERVNHVVLLPHGLEFDEPAKLTMSYANCDAVGSLLPKRIAYTTPNLRILEILRTLDNLRRRELTTELDHFSDYVLAW